MLALGLPLSREQPVIPSREQAAKTAVCCLLPSHLQDLAAETPEADKSLWSCADCNSYPVWCLLLREWPLVGWVLARGHTRGSAGSLSPYTDDDDDVLHDSVLPGSQPESSFWRPLDLVMRSCQDPRINSSAWRWATYCFVILLNVLGH